MLACAPTGSGKTAAFLLPILAHLKEPRKLGFRALVVSPTRELAQQTFRECCRLAHGSGFRIHVLTKAKASANNFSAQSSQRFDILVSTPNRLVHLLEQDPPGINLSKYEYIVGLNVQPVFSSSCTLWGAVHWKMPTELCIVASYDKLLLIYLSLCLVLNG